MGLLDLVQQGQIDASSSGAFGSEWFDFDSLWVVGPNKEFM